MSDDDIYGFTWGQVKVTRLSAVQRRVGAETHKCLGVSTDHNAIEVYVTPGGRSIRVFGKDGREWLPQ